MSKPAAPRTSTVSRKYFSYFDRNPNHLIYTLIGISLAVFLAWQYAIQSAQQFGDFKLLNFMRNNFLCDYNGVMRGKWWTLLTSTFSHNERG